MEYTVPFHSEISGDMVPLWYIAEAMARKAASGFGNRKLHGPTLQNTRTQYESLLLSAAREGRLKVCGSHGNVGAVDDLVNAAEGLSNEWSDAVKVILALHVKPVHLNDWAMTNGDVFHLIDVPADVLEYGPASPDGTKEYRGYVAWPFECFGEHGYFDAGQDGIPIELADDDFETDGFVKVAGAVTAVAKFLLSKGSPNRFQAERDAWPHILTGVVKGVLHPVSPTTLSPLSVDHCGNGMVLFSELVAWGQTTKLFVFRRAENAPVVGPVKVVGGGVEKANQPIPGRVPRVGIGRLAVTAAWQIECQSGRAATASKVIEQLQTWATNGIYPDILLRDDPRRRAVIWLTKKTGREKEYDMGACGKTLDEWRKSRA